MLGEVVSEKLKTAIEEAGLQGFIFTEIECDIIIEKANSSDKCNPSANLAGLGKNFIWRFISKFFPWSVI